MVELPNDTNEPYCSNCGYVLAKSVDSSKCPECGRPLVEVLTRRDRFSESGKRYRSKATILGLPVIDIALGPKHGQTRGKARGFIAIGDIATGWLALGGIARGFVAMGGLAVGVFSLGGLGVGLLTAAGGMAIGGLAAGGGAIGGAASGGGAVGYVAQGGGAIGYYARGGGAVGVHTVPMPPAQPSAEAQNAFDSMSWFFGAWPPSGLSGFRSMMVVAGLTIAVAVLLGLIAWSAMRSGAASQETWPPRTG
ncbi:MAG: hypothetical protein L0Y44_12335 [Phycisphaerales bacterium]|nr:hypothetical protein [Phycisphaerales bacterium]MCI0631429.1 hypothetical protein [Phycisphaerales bacterium]MCI0676584.1 hypothetical protein [Phycisphaerales bacterium]